MLEKTEILLIDNGDKELFGDDRTVDEKLTRIYKAVIDIRQMVTDYVMTDIARDIAPLDRLGMSRACLEDLVSEMRNGNRDGDK